MKWRYVWVGGVLFLNLLAWSFHSSDSGYNWFQGFCLLMLLFAPLVILEEFTIFDRAKRKVIRESRLFRLFPVYVKRRSYRDFNAVYCCNPPHLVMMIKEITDERSNYPVFVGLRKVGGGVMPVTYRDADSRGWSAEAQRIALEISDITGFPLVNQVGFHGTPAVCNQAELKESLQEMRAQILDVLDQLAAGGTASPRRIEGNAPAGVVEEFAKELTRALAKPHAARKEAVSKLLTLVEAAIIGK